MAAQIGLSIVAPVYNEEDSINEFYNRLIGVLKSLGLSYEILFIDDGSADRSVQRLRDLMKLDAHIRLIRFSRNFGHQIAVKAGIDHAQGEMTVIMDTDLQDPPEVIPEMIKKYGEGFDVVYAIRAKRSGESFFKKWTAAAYYRLMQRIAHVDIPIDTGDFRLISKKVVEEVRNIREKRPYIRGLISWLGFSQAGIFVNREARYAGHTKYSLKKMLGLAWNGITHFSFIPLQVSTYIGLATSSLCLSWIIVALYAHFIRQTAVPGWTSLIIAVLFLGSVQLITLGIIGSYLARNYDEARARPLYIVREKEGF